MSLIVNLTLIINQNNRSSKSYIGNIQINAKNGNMAFNEDKSKHNKVLINIKESKQEAIKIIVGKTGYLFKLKNSNNEYKFIYEENGKRKNFN